MTLCFSPQTTHNDSHLRRLIMTIVSLLLITVSPLINNWICKSYSSFNRNKIKASSFTSFNLSRLGLDPLHSFSVTLQLFPHLSLNTLALLLMTNFPFFRTLSISIGKERHCIMLLDRSLGIYLATLLEYVG